MLFFANLGMRGLWEPDEGRYSEIPREMIESGDWTVPHLNYVRYFEKPPLGYWLTAVSFKIFGYGEWQGRFFPALLALFGALITFWAGSRIWDKLTGLLAGLVLVTSLEYFILARIITLDMVLTFFVTCLMILFFLGYKEKAARKKRLLYIGAWVAMALAVLTKGPMAVVLPGAVILAFLLLRGELGRIRELQIPVGLVVFFVISAPWFILMCLRESEFYSFFFIHEHWDRFFTSQHQRMGPIYYFIPVLLLGFFPWSFFLPNAIRSAFKAPDDQPAPGGVLARIRSWPSESLYLVLWALVFFSFFSVSSSKLPTYILPIFPALALLVGRWWAIGIVGGIRRGSGLWSFGLMLGFVIVLGFVGKYLLYTRREDIDASVPYAIAFLAVMLVGVLSGLLLWTARRYVQSFFALTAGMCLLLILIPFGAKAIEDIKCSKPLSIIINNEYKEGEKIVHFGLYEQSMPFYTAQRPVLIDFRGELEFGLNIMGENDYYYVPKEGHPHPLERLIRGDKKIYLLTFDDVEHWGFLTKYFGGDLELVGHVGEKILLTNEPFLNKSLEAKN